jgi:hypothetical protein
MMGFRPVGYQDGDLVEDVGNLGRLYGDTRLSNQDVRALIDQAEALKALNKAAQRGNAAGFAGLPEDTGFAGLSDEDVRALEAQNVEGQRSKDSPVFEHMRDLEKDYERFDPSLIPLQEPGTGIPQKVAPPRSDLGPIPPGIQNFNPFGTPEERINTEVENLSARDPMTFSAQNNFRAVSETAETLKKLMKSFDGWADPLKEAAKAAITSLGIREDLVRAALQFIGDEDTQIPTSPIMSPGPEPYGINPASLASPPLVENINNSLLTQAAQDQMDAYYGGGVPGPSFRPRANRGPTGQTAPDLRNYMSTGSFRGATYGDPYFEDQLLPGGGEVPRGMRHGGIMSLRRR